MVPLSSTETLGNEVCMPIPLTVLTGLLQVKDRKIVAERMKAHVASPETTPLLIFPEGTCVNNEYCVMFKRGAFDMGATVCPIAIKYNKIFVDAFWNSKRQSFSAHLVSARCKWMYGPFWPCHSMLMLLQSECGIDCTAAQQLVSETCPVCDSGLA